MTAYDDIHPPYIVYCPTIIMNIGHIATVVQTHNYNIGELTVEEAEEGDDYLCYCLCYLCYLCYLCCVVMSSGDCRIANANMPSSMNALSMGYVQYTTK